eukprot:gb/GECH01009391.1/.p1 GENE.gb/GECH01009391.1/~~gb/GECH01009391.1/.p1  ORF type:complete len:230 (+),score=44.15 gb/GECH01009391.1/:1-690(+)
MVSIPIPESWNDVNLSNLWNRITQEFSDTTHYKVKTQSKDISLYVKQDDNTSSSASSIITVKVKGIVPAPPSVVATMLWDMGVRSKWEAYWVESKVLEKPKPDTQVVYWRMHSWGIADRDFVQIHTKRHDPITDTHTIGVQSVKHEKVPPREQEGFVRGHTYFSGVKISPLKQNNQINSDYSRVEYVTRTDMQGNIPSFVLSMGSMRGPASWLAQLAKQAPRYVKGEFK